MPIKTFIKTFKSALADSPVVLEVEDAPEAQGFYMTIGQSTVLLSPTVAPALMQAIVECLPPLPDIVRDGSHEAYMAVVVEYLDKTVRALEAEASEAKEQAKLEAEALGYWKAFHSVMGQGVEDDVRWSDLMPETQTKWLAVARKAREKRAEK